MTVDFRTLLPSAEHKAVREHILSRMKAAPLNFYQKPRYSRDDALSELLPLGVSHRRVMETWMEALQEYEALYPLQWDNEAQKAYRMVDRRRVEMA
jgi:hypothetical protein